MTVTTSPTQDFDYVVCGGGTSGSVVASRLSEDPGVTVLLVEAGPDSKGMENVDMIAGWAKLVDSTETDWDITAEPSPGLENRCVRLSRAKFLGGCSGCNGTLCTRGIKEDYDSWGLDGWSGDDMWKYMAKSETFHPKDWFDADTKSHGYDGPIHTEPMDLAPISHLVLQSMQEKGLKLCPDLFTTGESPNACGHFLRTRHKGLRSSAAAYVRDERPNLTILTETLVDKVLLDGHDESSELTAKAVQLIDNTGKVWTIKANREVIISGGTYCSPAILMRSGIGAKEELEPLDIKCQVDLPGVGKNLADHLIVFTFYEANAPDLTLDTHFLPTNLPETLRQWREERSGAFANCPFGVAAFTRLDERLSTSPIWTSAPRPSPSLDPMSLNPSTQPSVEIFSIECYGGPKQYADFPADKQHCFGIITELFAPRSRGTVKLRSKYPAENPIVDPNFLGDELGLDLEVLSEGVAFANEIITEGEATKAVLKGSWPSDDGHHRFKGREEWKGYVKRHATTCYHPTGTVKMGSKSDPLAVLDERLRVRGVRGLRVVDVSVMPISPQAHTQIPAYGIGEKAADLIREDWNWKRGE